MAPPMFAPAPPPPPPHLIFDRSLIAVITQVLNNPPHVWFVPSTRIFLAKAVYMVLGSSCLSARKILALGTSTTFACKLNTEEIWR